MGKDFWSEAEIELIKKHYGKIYPRDFRAMFPDKAYNTVRHKAMRMGLRSSPKWAGKRYDHNEDFFSVPSILSAYWAGMIASDGNIHNNSISIGLKSDDKAHIEQFARDVGWTGPINIKTNHTIHGITEVATLAIRDDQWIKDLYRHYNLVPRKSLILLPPNNLNYEQSLSYICGYLDGDGWTSIEKPRGYKNINGFAIGAIGTKETLLWMKEFFDEISPHYHNLDNKLQPQIGKDRNCYSLNIHGLRGIKVYHKLMSIPTPKLYRKWHSERMVNVYNQYKLNYPEHFA